MLNIKMNKLVYLIMSYYRKYLNQKIDWPRKKNKKLNLDQKFNSFLNYFNNF